MIVELLKDIRLECGTWKRKGTLLHVHPSDGDQLIKEKKAIEQGKQLNIKQDGKD